jgi:hypothetical protein
MSQPTYYDQSGKEVVFYHPVDALEALDLGVITTKKKGSPVPAPAIEPVQAIEPPAAEEEIDKEPRKKAPRRRSVE